MSNTVTTDRLLRYVDEHREVLLRLLEDLIRIPSENRSPLGAEAECQKNIAATLKSVGYEVDVYEADKVDGLFAHPIARSGRNYTDRPNVAARRKGSGGGRSLILSGHIDTVPRGDLPWTRDAFTPERVGNRMYGRGSNDMKAGVAMNLFVMLALADLRAELAGDVVFESVVDEEFGGVNGTLAGRLRGYVADAAVVTEPSSLRLCAGQRGGRTAHLLFKAQGGVLASVAGASVVDQITYFLTRLPEFAAQRRNSYRPHPLYAAAPDPIPVIVTKITTGPWGTSEPITVPEQGGIELYWQLMPDETQAQVDGEFFAWVDSILQAPHAPQAQRPEITFAVAWLPGSAIAAESEVCRVMQQAAYETLGRRLEICGLEAPCDLYVFHQFGVPAILWGPSGGQTHGSDEWVEIDSVVDAAKALLRFVYDWCGNSAR